MPTTKIRHVPFHPDEWIAGTLGLTLEEEGLYARITARIYSRGEGLPTDEHVLAHMCNVRPQVLRRVLNRLKLLGKLHETGTKLTSNRCETEMKLARNSIETSMNNGRLGGRPSQNQTLTKPDGFLSGKPNLKPITNNQGKKEDSCSSKPMNGHAKDLKNHTKSGDDPDFDEMWSAYPRKQAKGHARTAYRTARKKTTADTILAAVNRYRDACRDTQPQFIALGATWLNGERWLDEEIKTNGHDRASSLPLNAPSDDVERARALNRILKGLQIPS